MYQEELERALQGILEDLNILLQRNECDRAFLQLLQNVLSVYAEISDRASAWNQRTISENLAQGQQIFEEILECIDAQKSMEQLLEAIYNFGKTVETLSRWLSLEGKHYILIYGINEKTANYMYCLDLEKTCVMAFVVKDKKLEQTEYMGIPVIDLSQLEQYEYEYLLCCEPLEEPDMYPYEKILDIHTYIWTYVMGGYELGYERMNFYRNRGPYDGIVTGLSYVRQGIDLPTIKGRFLNFAIGGQDLFYSFCMFRYAYEHAIRPECVKYAIIGVSPYIFQYDMSKTAYNAAVAQRYYSYVGRMNHFSAQWLYKGAYHNIRERLQKIMKEDFEDIYTTTEEAYFLNYEKSLRNAIYDSSKLDAAGIEQERESIKKEYHKDYPETVAFNIRILEEYLQYLEERDIKPILVMPPMTQLYKEYMSWEIYEDTIQTLNSIKERYEFVFVNLLLDLELEDSYFRNSSHLNGKGAVKVTEILNQYLD